MVEDPVWVQVYTEVYLLYIKLGGALSLWVLLAFVNSEHRDGDT